MRRQSEHLAAYRRCARETRRTCVYPSFESRAEIARLVAERDAKGHWPRDPDGAPLYPGNAKRLSAAERRARMADEPYALRLDMNAAVARTGALTWVEIGAASQEHATVMAHPEAWGDVVLARKEMPTSYHLSVVVDDALQGVTHVVRGQDLQPATSVHRLLQALLGLQAPVYHHHRLILDEDGRKLSKSTRATALRELREPGPDAGRHPPARRAELARISGDTVITATPCRHDTAIRSHRMVSGGGAWHVAFGLGRRCVLPDV